MAVRVPFVRQSLVILDTVPVDFNAIWPRQHAGRHGTGFRRVPRHARRTEGVELVDQEAFLAHTEPLVAGALFFVTLLTGKKLFAHNVNALLVISHDTTASVVAMQPSIHNTVKTKAKTARLVKKCMNLSNIAVHLWMKS